MKHLAVMQGPSYIQLDKYLSRFTMQVRTLMQ